MKRKIAVFMRAFLVCIFFFLPFFSSLGQSFPDDLYYQLFEEIKSGNPKENTQSVLDSLLNLKTLSRFDRAKACNLKGIYLDLRHRKKEAIAAYEKAMDLFGENYSWRAKVQLNMSTSYSQSYQYTKAISLLMEVAKVAEEQKDLSLQTKVKEYFANLYFEKGDIAKALGEMEQLACYYEQKKDTLVLSRLYNNLAVLYRKNEAYEKAISFNVKSLRLSKAQNNHLSLSQSYNNIGLNYEKLFYQTDSVPYIERAIAFYQQASQIKREYPEVWNTALSNLIRVYRLLGEYDKANQHFLELSENKRADHKQMESMLREKMLFALNRGNSMQAYRYLFKLDSVQRNIRDLQTHDFEQMLKNQRDLFESKKREKEKELALKEEHNLRLMTENKHNRFKIIYLTLLVVILSGLLVFVFHYKSIIHKNQQEKKDLQLNILRAQMNPHFIFNVLTAIQNSLLDDDPLKTAGYIARFSKLIRQNFDFTNKERISFAEDVEALINYIETQKIRFGNKFDYEIDVDQSIREKEIFIPPMMLQPLVENAIEHGLKKCKHKGDLHVKIKQEAFQLLFSVVDNGVGYTARQSDGKKHALDVLKARLSLLGYGDEKTFLIQRLGTDGGTRVEFTLTLKKDV